MSAKLRRQKRKQTGPTRRTQAVPESLLTAVEQRIADKAKRFYEAKLKTSLEKSHPGMFAAIEADSGDYFLGMQMGDALTEAKSKYPNKLVYVVRIGFRAAATARTQRCE